MTNLPKVKIILLLFYVSQHNIYRMTQNICEALLFE